MTTIKHRVVSSTSIKIMTTIVSCILLMSIVLLVRMMYLQVFSTSLIFALLVLLGICLAVGYVVVLQPRYIEVTQDQVLIHRVVGVVTINIDDIVQVNRKKTMLYDMRRFGSGGFCGNIGYFCSKDEGRYFAYVKDTRKMVYIQTTSRGYVISCEQPDQFIEELE